MTTDGLKAPIRDIPDFPTECILFSDIKPLLADLDAFRCAIAAMAEPYEGIDHEVCIESLGFILGTPIAYKLDAGLVPVRNTGRLPSLTLSEDHSLEYGVMVLVELSDLGGRDRPAGYPVNSLIGG